MQKTSDGQNYKLLHLCMDFGTQMLEVGAETSRVEDSVKRILEAHDKKAISIFAIPTLLLVTFEDDEGIPYTSSVRIKNITSHFDRLDRLNHLSRTLCSGEVKSLEYFQEQLELIRQSKLYKLPVLLLAAVVVGMGFSYVFGGTVADILWSGPIALAMKAFYELLDRAKLNSTYVNLMASFSAGFLAELFFRLNLLAHPSIVTVAVVMNLVPGMLLTNAIYDIIHKDFTAGLNKLIESVFVAVALAVGTGSAVLLFR